MKIIISVFTFCLLLAGSSSASNNIDLIEVEEILQERQHDLQNSTPLNEEEKAVLKRMLSEKTIRFNDSGDSKNRQHDRRNLADSGYSDDSLANAMLESARAKIQSVRGRIPEQLPSRSLQDSTPTRLKDPMEPSEPKKADGSANPALMIEPEEMNVATPSKGARVVSEHKKPERMASDKLQGSEEDLSSSITRSLQQTVVE